MGNPNSEATPTPSVTGSFEALRAVREMERIASEWRMEREVRVLVVE